MKLAAPGLCLVSLATLIVSAPLPSMSQEASPGRTLLTLRAPGVDRVWYPPGQFRMGSSPEEVLVALTSCAQEPLAPRCPDFSNEQPARTVTLSRFALDAKEVSVAAYARCVHAHRCSPLPYYRGARRFDVDSLPAVLVTHQEAQRYCAFVGGALPTEAQFERAARGVTRRNYPWGNGYHRAVSNHGRLAFNATDAQDGSVELAPVDSYSQGATPEGVLNLAGNVAEWVSDVYVNYYDERDIRDPIGPAADSESADRVTRGGSYLSPASLLRGAARQPAVPSSRGADLGFRCAYNQLAPRTLGTHSRQFLEWQSDD